LRIGDNRACAGVRKAMAERIYAEEHEQRDGNRTKFWHRDMTQGGFLGGLRKKNSYTIAPANSVRGQQVRQPVRLISELAEIVFARTAVRFDKDERESVRVDTRPFVADVNTDVVMFRNLPIETLCTPVRSSGHWATF
jgi:hypothetical protein